MVGRFLCILADTAFKCAVVILSLSACGMLEAKNGTLINSVHWPKHGDKVTKVQYEYQDMPVDTIVWNFGEVVETGLRYDTRWLNYGDSVLARTEGGGQTTYQCVNDSVFLTAAEDCFIKLSEASLSALVWPVNTANNTIDNPNITFKGLFCDKNAVETKSVVKVSDLGKGCLILPMDTLQNAKRIRTEISEILKVWPTDVPVPVCDTVSAPFDSLYHTVITDRWYADAYRYELVENIIETYSRGNKSIFTQGATYVVSPDAQEYDIDTDKVRTRDTDTPGNDNRNSLSQTFSLEDNLIFDYDGRTIQISFSSGEYIGDNPEISLLLYDSLGRVRQRDNGVINDGYWYESLSTQDLPPGNYMVTVTVCNQNQSYKFTIK